MESADVIVRVMAAGYDELTPEQRMLVDRAREATFRSYAPYSEFNVGAAVLLSDGEIVEGSNQENAAFPSGLCAERTACFYAHSRFPDARFVAIAIAARDKDGEFVAQPIPPCGACRQALLEYEALSGRPVQVLLAGRDKVLIVESVSALLPLSFSNSHLKS